MERSSLSIAAIRALGIDAINKANSGYRNGFRIGTSYVYFIY